LKKHKCVLDFISTRTHIINPMVKIRSRRGKAATDTLSPKFMHGRSTGI
jgi:hypothetical protein